MGVYRYLEGICPDSSTFSALLWGRPAGKQNKTNSGLPVIQTNFEQVTTYFKQPI
jgi:hypothetical protein